MKDFRYANRGAAFEDIIRFANTRYVKSGIAVIEKLPTEFIPLRNSSGKICSAKVEHKSKVDFIGRYKSFPIAVEAKNSKTDSIRFDRVEPHQADYMDVFTAQPGTIGFVLISFDLDRFYAVPWAFWGAAYDIRVRRNDRSRSVDIQAFGQQWRVPPKFSVREEELLPEWRVPSNDRKYGLHYLINAEKYISKNYNLQEKTE
jgi:recombination protein U